MGYSCGLPEVSSELQLVGADRGRLCDRCSAEDGPRREAPDGTAATFRGASRPSLHRLGRKPLGRGLVRRVWQCAVYLPALGLASLP